MIPALPVIFAYPLIVIVLFARLDVPKAICCSIVLGYLFLPTKTAFNLPMLPTIDKGSMPSFAVILALLIFGGAYAARNPDKVRPGVLPRHPLPLLLMGMMFVGAVMTVLTNSDPLRFELRSIPGLRTYDAFSALLGTGVTLLPLLIARKYLATEQAHKVLLFTIAAFAVIYSFPIIFELVMSPQLNIIVYGFFPHSWTQHVRGDGYRPVVFLQHGLWLGIFISCAVIATFGYSRIVSGQHKLIFLISGAWLLLILALCKSLGAFMIALVILPVVLFFGVRLQLIFAACVAGAVLFYPMLRGADLVPVDKVLTIAERIDVRRANSFAHRLNNEDMLLAKANERPLFGWGGWGRARIYNEAGRDISTTDGRWVISIGSNGWFGYVARFGLLGMPLIMMALLRRRYDIGIATSVLGLVLAGNLVDLIPNAGLTPVTWLMAGAMIGRLEVKSAQTEEEESATAQSVPKRRLSPYSRATRIKPNSYARKAPRV